MTIEAGHAPSDFTSLAPRFSCVDAVPATTHS